MMFQKELSCEFSLKKRLLGCSNLSLVAFERGRFWPSTAFLSSWYKKWTIRSSYRSYDPWGDHTATCALAYGSSFMKSERHAE